MEICYWTDKIYAKFTDIITNISKAAKLCSSKVRQILNNIVCSARPHDGTISTLDKVYIEMFIDDPMLDIAAKKLLHSINLIGKYAGQSKLFIEVAYSRLKLIKVSSKIGRELFAYASIYLKLVLVIVQVKITNNVGSPMMSWIKTFIHKSCQPSIYKCNFLNFINKRIFRYVEAWKKIAICAENLLINIEHLLNGEVYKLSNVITDILALDTYVKDT